MFVRKKRNKSGSISVQIIEKTGGGYRVVQTLGSSRDVHEVERLFLQAQQVLHAPAPKQPWLLSIKSKEDLAIESFVGSLSNAQVRTVGPELIFGALFDRTGFNIIPEELFRHITIARLVYPVSKLKTVDYLFRYQGHSVSVYTIYRFLDRLSGKYKEQVEGVAYRHTKERLGGSIAVVFYDMTTLYFESEDEDDLRKLGYSKDGKFEHPQIMLGLLVGEEGLPIGYDIFEGNTFEGHTLLPVLRKIRTKYGLDNPIVVADAALLSHQNIEGLKEEGYPFILGGRLKNESESVRAAVLEKAVGMVDGDAVELKRPDGSRLVVTYSAKRAKKDAWNREKGLKKLRARVRTGRLTKESLNNRGYNKFLRIEGMATVIIDEDKIKADQTWDGLKAYITNTSRSAMKVAATYVHLWQIEKAFRISKTDLRVRPIYHHLKHRIEAHVCIAFVAYTIYKEMERLLKVHQISMSPKRAAELTHTMYELEYILPGSAERKRQLLRMDADQRMLYEAVQK